MTNDRPTVYVLNPGTNVASVFTTLEKAMDEAKRVWEIPVENWEPSEYAVLQMWFAKRVDSNDSPVVCNIRTQQVY